MPRSCAGNQLASSPDLYEFNLSRSGSTSETPVALLMTQQ
jgi:hypothetical protein